MGRPAPPPSVHRGSWSLVIAVLALGLHLVPWPASGEPDDLDPIGREWRVSANDPGTTRVCIEPAVSAHDGEALAICGRFPQSIGASVEPALDWRPYGALELRVFVPRNAPRDISAYVYLQDRQYLWYQARLSTGDAADQADDCLRPGRWNDSTVDISPDSHAWQPGGHARPWLGATFRPREFGIRFFSRARWAGTLRVEQLRLVPRTEPYVPPRQGAPLAVRSSAGTLPCYGKLELTFPVDYQYANPFDTGEVEVTGHFRGPSGDETDVPGFLYQDYRRRSDCYGDERLTPVGRPEWKVRFCPTTPGRYEYFVSLRDCYRYCRSRIAPFSAAPADDTRGFVRVSAADPRYLEFANGEACYPMGINARDAGADAAVGTYAFDRLFPALHASGVSLVRTWMSAPWLGLEWTDKCDPRYDGAGRYCLANAWRLDYVLDLAERTDMRIVLVLNHHGQLRRDKFDAEWFYNPLAAANGGPVAQPGLFFGNQAAKALVRRRYRYIVARWAYSPRILAWELWNEVDITDHWDFAAEEVTRWHRELGGCLRSPDPWHHLVTTHYCMHWRPDHGLPLWQLGEIDYMQADAYWPQAHIADDISLGYACRQAVAKPYFVAEYGPTAAQLGAQSPRAAEATFRIGLWSSAMMPLAGTALFWFPDVWLQRGYGRHHRALASFLAGEDPRRMGWQWIDPDPQRNPQAPTTTCPDVYVQAMTSPGATRFYAFAPSRMAGAPSPAEMAYGDVSVHLRGIADGHYAGEFWDPADGRPTAGVEVVAVGGETDVKLPPFAEDIACKLQRAQ